MNLLHRNSFILGNLYEALDNEIQKGFISQKDLAGLKKLMHIIVAKHDYAPKSKKIEAANDMAINKKNKLPIDRILATGKKTNKFIR